MVAQIHRELQHCRVVAPVRGEQQPLGVQVVHHGDVVLADSELGLVDADQTHLAHVLLAPGLGDVELDAPPQLLVPHTQHVRGLTYRQPLAQRQAQRLEQQRKAAALACPRHAHLGRLAAGRTGHARHLGVQPGLELEEVQVTPLAAYPVVDALIGRAARRAAKRLGLATNLKVDSVLGSIELHGLHRPRCLQTQRRGEQRLDFDAHEDQLSKQPRQRRLDVQHRPVDMWTGSNAACPHAHRARL